MRCWRSVPLVVLAAMLALVTACGGTSADQRGPSGGTKTQEQQSPAGLAQGPKVKLKVAYQDEAIHHAVFWALKHGKVTSATVDVELHALGIPALVQATGTKQYDILQTSNLAIPRLKEKGLDAVIIATAVQHKEEANGIFVHKDSSIKSPSDLKGKTLALDGLGSAHGMLTRLVLWKKYGLNIAAKGGDLQYQDAPTSNIPALVQQQKVAAGVYSHYANYMSRRNPEFRLILDPEKAWREIAGVPGVTSVFATYGEHLKKKGDAIREALRLMQESRKYLESHRDEVVTAITKEYKVEKEFVDYWFARQSDFRLTLTRGDITSIETMWKLAHEAEELPQLPKTEDVFWMEGVQG